SAAAEKLSATPISASAGSGVNNAPANRRAVNKTAAVATTQLSVWPIKYCHDRRATAGKRNDRIGSVPLAASMLIPPSTSLERSSKTQSVEIRRCRRWNESVFQR